MRFDPTFLRTLRGTHETGAAHTNRPGDNPKIVDLRVAPLLLVTLSHFTIQLAHENHKTSHQELLATSGALASLLCE